MSFAEIFQSLQSALQPQYGDREAGIMANMLLEKISGQRSHVNLQTSPAAEEVMRIDDWLERLLNNEPIQYILQESWFQNMKFYVDGRVLIPRPETEELVEWIVQDEKANGPFQILDIGSGSGCIPVSLAKKMPAAIIHSCDISPGALEVAKINATNLNAAVHFHLVDFLNETNWPALQAPDIIVSNPPYIPQYAREQMEKNVTEHEPSEALFVPDENPLVFYAAIAKFALIKEKKPVKIFVEIHKDMAIAVMNCFTEAGLTSIELRRDMQGEERMVKAILQ